MADGGNPYDKFDETPSATGEGAPRTEMVQGRPMSTVGGLPEPTEQDQATAAREARQSAGSVPRRRARPQEPVAQPEPETSATGGNLYDRFDGDPKDDGVAVMERLRLNTQDAFYRSSLAGSTRLALLAQTYRTADTPDLTPEMKAVNKQQRDEYLKIVSDLAAYDEMEPWGSTLEATVALGGQLAGTLISPESWIGWGAKGATWLARSARAGVQQAGIQVATDPAIQALDISAGVQQGFDPARTALSGALGFGIGAGGHLAGEGIGKIIGQGMLRRQMADLAKEDKSFANSLIELDMLTSERGASPIVRGEGETGTAPRPEYAAGMEHGFSDAVKVERARLTAEGKPRRGAGLNEEAQFNAFHEEVGDVLQQAVDAHGLDPENVRYGEIWRHYDRQAGEPPEAALERAIGKWVSAEERAAVVAVDDSQLIRDLDEWARTYDAEAERAMRRGGTTDYRGGKYDIDLQNRDGGGTELPGMSPVILSYRPAHLPEEIPFERPQVNARESGDLPPRGEPQPGQAEGTAGGGAEPAIRGERGGERPAGGEAPGAAAAAAGGENLEWTRARSSIPEIARNKFSEASTGDIGAGIGEPLGGWAAEGGWGFEKLSEHEIKRLGSLSGEDHLAALRKALRDAGQEGWRFEAVPDDMRTARFVDGKMLPGGNEARAAAAERVLALYIDEKGNRLIPTAEFNRESDVAWVRANPSVERTAQGEQTLMPGVAPVTDRQRIETEMGKPMAGGSKPPPAGGLFDADARAQQDMFLAQRRRGDKMAGEPERIPAERVEMPSPQEDVAIRSLQQQSMDLAAALDFPLRQGRVSSRTAAGVFSPRTGVVRVREVPDFDVVSHEAGHAIEAKDREITALIKANAAELRPLDYDQTDKGRRESEGFAEFVRWTMTNPAYAQRQAPGFATEFRAFMAAKHPDILAKIDAAAAAYRTYLEAPSVDAVASVRRSVDEDPKGIAKVTAAIREDGLPTVIKSVMQKSYDAILDDKAPFARAMREMAIAIRDRTGRTVDLKAVDNPEILQRMVSRARQAAVRDLMDGVRPYRSVTPEGPSLADAISEATGSPSVWGKWDEAKRADFDTYLIARRAEYLWRKYEAGEIPNPPVAFSKGDTEITMRDLEAAMPSLRNASDMVHEYNRQTLRKAYDGGLITADLYTKLGEEEFYVPFMRDMSDRPVTGSGMGQGGEGPGTTQVVKRLRGSARDIKSPLESIMAQTFMINRTLRHNDVVKAFVDLSRRAGPEGGQYVEPIPAQEARKYVADLEQAITNRAKEIGMDPAEAQNMIAALGDPEGEGGLVQGSYFKMEQAAARGEPIVFYREGGELKAARFMSEKEGHGLYEILTAAPEPVTDLWVQMIGAAASLKRTGIVTNPTFAITNYFRDQVAASILRSDYVPIYSGAKGIRDEFRQAQSAVLYGYAGGVAGGASTGPVEHAFRTEVDALAKKGYLVNRVTSFKGLLELASFTEAGTRNSIFDTVFQASKRKGLSDYEAMVEGAFQAQDLLDFSRHGSRTIAIRNLLPFLNAHMQGLDKARRTLIEPITNRIRNGEVFATDSASFNNALAAWTKAGALGGALGAMWAAINADSEAYRDASPYFKGTHIVMPWGNKIVVMPKPFELGIGFTAGEYAFHALAQHDPRAARQFVEAAWQSMAPPNPITDIPVLSTTTELALGKSLFSGRDIVPEQLQSLPAEQQFNDRTSELAKWLGKQTGLSPMKIEYGIGAEFGLWGRDVMALSQGVNENSPAASLDDAVFTRRFVKDPTRSSTVTTKFWDYMSRTTGKFNQDVKGYNQMVKDAITERAPMTTATEFLAKLPAAERAFVTLKSGARPDGKPAFTADERRLHPLQNAYDAVEMLNALRREIATNAQMTFGGREKVTLNPSERRLLLENVRELAQLSMRNGLAIMGEGGYAGRPILDPNDTMDKIRAVSPAIADEIASRYATNKVYTTEAVRRAWPDLRDRLVREGSEADVRGLAFDAKAEGYQFSGVRAKRPPILRQPIAGQPVPAR